MKMKYSLFYMMAIILMNFCITSTSARGEHVFSPEDFLRGDIVVRSKWQFKQKAVPKKQYYVFYMGAKWCPPCHQFTKKLRAFYEEAQLRGHNFEVFYVSLDRTKEDMLAYMRSAKMPWPAIAYKKSGKTFVLSEMLGRAPPALLIMDRKGNVLISSYKDGVLAPPGGALQDFARLLDKNS
ncbi:MAG: redoxin domain-containing protein [Emcibacter sp.]|nr:redoxin domain-containing protein [Emcibacter sp.]